MTVTDMPAATALQDLDAERSVLGSCLLEPPVVAEVQTLRADDFALPRHALIYSTIVDVFNSTGATDPLAVKAALEREGRLADAGGLDYLLDLVEGVVTGRTVSYHAELVREKAQQRRLRDVGYSVVQAVNDGGDIGDVIANAEVQIRSVAESMAPQLPWRMRTWDEAANDPPQRWLIDGIEPECGLLLTGGDPASGKSLGMLDRAVRKACGVSWMGRRTRPASTIILAYEAGRGYGVRVRALRAAHPDWQHVDGHYVAIVDGGPDLTQPKALAQLIEIIDQATKKYGRKPDSIVFDTWNLAAPGIDENDSGTVGLAMRTLAELRHVREVSQEIIHHLKKPQPGAAPRGMHALRGSSALVGAADVVLVATGDKDARVLRVEKCRDGEIGQPIHYTIVGQDTGMAREDGRPEFGPIIVPAGPPIDEEKGSTATVDEQVEAVVATVDRLGGRVSSKRQIVDNTKGKDGPLYLAIGRAVEAGRLLPDGDGFVLPGQRCPLPLPPKGGAAGQQADFPAARQRGQHTGSTGSRGAE